AGAQHAPPPVPAAAPPMPSPSSEPTTAQRLQELETLRATAITDAEYATKRQQIIADL
ncbi:SHOCT domain-containing protein, partial [Mycobacterium rufum]|nr:SHOCT domain-containing protein [Mycolicibacterium rufum]